MAQIVPDPVNLSYSSRTIPETPTKSGVMVSSSEITEERTPAPVYAETATTHMNSFLNEAARLFEKSMKTETKHHHPINPTGNVTHDLRDHLPCHQNFNNNVEVVLHRYKQLRKDYEDATYQLGKAQRDLRREVEEKESWKSRCKELEVALSDEQQAHNVTREELARVQAELFETQLRLDSAIKQLADAVQKLEAARKALREMTRQRDVLQLKVLDLERDLEYYTTRVAELQKAVDVANEGENCANDRNARLTIMLFQIEAQKAEIEREKDRAQGMIRNLKDELKDVTSRNGIERLRKEIEALTQQKAVIEKALKDAQNDVTNRDLAIQYLNAQIVELNGEVSKLEDEKDHLRRIKNRFVNTVKEYQRAVVILKTFSHKKHKKCDWPFNHIQQPIDDDETSPIWRTKAVVSSAPAIQYQREEAEVSQADAVVEKAEEITTSEEESKSEVLGEAELREALSQAVENGLRLYQAREDEEADPKAIEEVVAQHEKEISYVAPKEEESVKAVNGEKTTIPEETKSDLQETTTKSAAEEGAVKTVEEKKPTTEEEAGADEPTDTNTDA